MSKKVLSALFSLMFMISCVTQSVYGIGINGKAEQNFEIDDNNLSIESENSLGSLINDKLSDDSNSSLFSCRVTSAEFNDEKNIAVEFVTDIDSSLIVAIYDESGEKMICSNTVSITPDMKSIEVAIPDFAEEYYTIKVYIVDSLILSPLSEVYENDLHTQHMQEFMEMTVNDFDEEKVVNFDEDETGNFAVYNDNTTVVEEQEGVNTVLKADDENGEYILENIDETVAGLNVGDIFAYQYGEDGYILAKVGSIEIDGNTATIKSQETSLDEIFDYFKLDDEITGDDCDYSTEGIPDVMYSDFDEENKTAEEAENSEEPIIEEESEEVDFNTEELSVNLPDTDILETEEKIEIDGDISTGDDGSVTGKVGLNVKVSFDKTLDDWKNRKDTAKPDTEHDIVGAKEKQVAIKSDFTGYLKFGFSISVKIFIAPKNDSSKSSYFEFVFKETDEISITLESKITYTHPFFHVTFSGPYGLKFKYEPTVTIEASGSVEIKGTCIKESGIRLQNGKIENISKDPIFTPTAKIEASFSIAIDMGPTLCFLSEYIAKFHLKIEGKIIVSAETTYTKDYYVNPDNKEDEDIHDCVKLEDGYDKIGCIEGTIDGKLTIGAEVGFFDLEPDAKDSKKSRYLPEGSVERNICKFYYSMKYEHWGTKSCPHRKYYYSITVLNRDGEPVENALVKSVSEGGETLSSNVKTDEEGKATVYLTAGKNKISVRADNYENYNKEYNVGVTYEEKLSLDSDISKNNDVKENDKKENYIDKKTDINISAKRDLEAVVKINGKKSRSNEIKLSDKTYAVSLTVKDEDGNILKNAKITGDYEYAKEDDTFNVRANSSGVYKVKLPDGEYHLDAVCFGHSSDGGADITVDKADTDAEITVCANSCTFHVVDQNGDSVGGATIDIRLIDDEPYISASTNKTDSNGYFTRLCDEGKNKISVSKLNAVSYSGTITIPKGGGEFEIAVQNNLKKVDVYVTDKDNNPLSDASVYSYQTAKTVKTDSDGYAQIYLPIGENQLRIIKDGYTMQKPDIIVGDYTMKPHTYALAKSSSSSSSSSGSSDDIEWNIDENGCLTISGSGKMRDYSSDSTSDWLKNKTSIKTVIIEDGITSIGENAFCDCTFLTEITIPDSVTSIGRYAFSRCTGLTSITIPDSVTYLSGFSGCTGLTEITIPDSVTSIGYEAFEGCTGLTSVTIPDSVTSIGYCAFGGCTGLTSITIPDSVTSIGYEAFKGCAGLKEITIPDSITSIGSNAFEHTGLRKITIPDSVTSIGESAFKECKKLTSITIPDSVTSIGESAFKDCTGLTEITIPDSVTLISDSAFDGCNIEKIIIAESSKTIISKMIVCKETLKEVIIPDSVTSIGDSAFKGCTRLTEITIPDSVTSIGYSAFMECTELTSIILPYGIISIANGAFANCTGLTEITIPDSVTEIGYSAFKDCSIKKLIIADGSETITSKMIVCRDTVEEIVIPYGVTYIEDGSVAKVGVFEGCNALKEIKIPETVTYIGEFAFWECESLASVQLNDNITSIERGAFGCCTNLTNIVIPSGVDKIGSKAFQECKKLTEIKIPDSVTSIGSYAFYVCTGLTEITISDSVTSMGSDIFSFCPIEKIIIAEGSKTVNENMIYGGIDLKEVVIPESVTSIGNNAFSGCAGLTSITIPDSVTSIGVDAFNGCKGLTEIIIPDSVTYLSGFFGCTGLTSITIPNSVTSIGKNAFARCTGLTSITIPNSVTSIGYDAFYGCTGLTEITIPDSVTSIGEMAFYDCPNITDVYYSGTYEDWKNISIESGNEYLTYAMKYYNSTGPETTSFFANIPTNNVQLYYKPISMLSNEDETESVPFEDTAAAEPETTTETEIYTETTTTVTEPVSMKESENSAAETTITDGLNSETVANLIPNDVYNVYVVKTSEAEDILSADNLIYLNQATSDENGEISVSFTSDMELKGYEIFTVHAKYGMSAVSLEAEILDYTGENQTPVYKVSNGGYELVEGIDYKVAELPELIKPGYYSIVIEGIGNYYGTTSRVFAIVCEHEYENSVCTICGIECPHNYQEGICTYCGAEEITFLLGDVDGDGTVSAMDASAALTYYVMNPATIEELGFPFNIKAADWDENGIIDARDASAILTYYVSH